MLVAENGESSGLVDRSLRCMAHVGEKRQGVGGLAVTPKDGGVGHKGGNHTRNKV